MRRQFYSKPLKNDFHQVVTPSIVAGAVGIEPTSAVLETAILADELCPYRLAERVSSSIITEKNILQTDPN